MTLYLSYFDLSPELENPLDRFVHDVLILRLRESFPHWTGFSSKHSGYDLGFILVTQIGNHEVLVKGPSSSKKLGIIDFTIFLPERIGSLHPDNPEDICTYLEWTFHGIAKALQNFEVSWDEVCLIKRECIDDLSVTCTEPGVRDDAGN